MRIEGKGSVTGNGMGIKATANALWVIPKDAAGADLEGGLAANISTQTTTLVKTGAGVLRSIVFNKMLAATTVLFYDGITAGGTLLGSITVPATTLQTQVSLQYNIAFATGLTVVTGVANSDITVVYR